jgi:tetratricopeptide (TPR) repeat protein
VDANGFVEVDSQLRTADARIFAAGDVTGAPLLADKALHQGRIAAEVIAGKDGMHDARAIPFAIFTDPQIAWCGYREEDATSESESVSVAKIPWGASGRAVGMGRIDGMTKIIFDRESKLVLGVGNGRSRRVRDDRRGGAGDRNGRDAHRSGTHDPSAPDVQRADRGCSAAGRVKRFAIYDLRFTIYDWVVKRSKTDALPSPARHPTMPPWVAGALIVIATMAAYWPALSGGFIWDDDDYVTKNEHLTSLRGLIELWIPGTTHQYYPAVFTTFWIEHQLWQLNPSGYHIVNVLLHAMNALLVWRLAYVLRIPGAWMIGAVFALHPVHVESVAWITERKNVLSGLFYLSAAVTYLRFDDGHEIKAASGGRWWWYAWSLLLFVLALLSKSVTCSLPAALILMMLWQRKPLTIQRIGPLVPLFVIGLALALHTAHLERSNVGAVGPDFEFSLMQRLIIASNALAFYAQMLIAPWPLIFIYERGVIDSTRLTWYVPLFAELLIGVASLVLYVRGKRGPLLALLFFAGTLVPALGFFNVYPMRFSFVADHFQYLASLGIIALLVGVITTYLKNQRLAALLAVVVLGAFGTLTWQRCWAFQSEEILWRWTIQQNPRAWIAYNNLGKILLEQAREADFTGHPNVARDYRSQAIEKLRQAHELKMDDEQLHRNLGAGLREAGRYTEALEVFRELVRLGKPYHMDVGQVLDALGRPDEAEQEYRAAIVQPGFNPDALMLLGGNLQKRGRVDEAVQCFQRFLEFHPADANAMLILADAHAKQGSFDEALRMAHQALDLAQVQHQDGLAAQIQQRISDFQARTAPAR